MTLRFAHALPLAVAGASLQPVEELSFAALGCMLGAALFGQAGARVRVELGRGTGGFRCLAGRVEHAGARGLIPDEVFGADWFTDVAFAGAGKVVI